MMAAALLSPPIAAALAALAGIVLTLAAMAARRVFAPKPPTVADVATAQAGQAVAQGQASVAVATATATAAMAQAATDAPTTQAEVVDSLNKGEF